MLELLNNLIRTRLTVKSRDYNTLVGLFFGTQCTLCYLLSQSVYGDYRRMASADQVTDERCRVKELSRFWSRFSRHAIFTRGCSPCCFPAFCCGPRIKDIERGVTLWLCEPYSAHGFPRRPQAHVLSVYAVISSFRVM